MRKGGLALPLLAVLGLSGCGVSVHFGDYKNELTSDATVNGQVKAVNLDSKDGRLVIRAGGSAVRIHRVVHYQDGTPHPGQRLDSGTLTFTRGCSRCKVDYELTVPASVTVQARADSGRIDVTGVATADASSDSGSVAIHSVKGAVRAHSDSGSIVVEDVGSPLTLTTDSGSIHATRLTAATVRAHSKSGSVRLTFAAPPTNVNATTDSASLRVAVPGGPYNVDADTDSGGKDVAGVPHDQRAPRRLYLRTDSGHLTAEHTTS
ncbi:DUF4097 family beta strand repeat-containing protein [Actinoallomurus soli]|uniref:DUF4097 family beta strand repeat-containing protein n=1 Tax=Actinoallomurus soli TaxID=2952535 RepID=UPI002092D2A1|nr:DUF4097 family beta strand repeat-containing protein [Actinoallomurus soli]MCO5968681.1 DUF4097 domain-containing protein [Actinoallomurus soli]